MDQRSVTPPNEGRKDPYHPRIKRLIKSNEIDAVNWIIYLTWPINEGHLQSRTLIPMLETFPHMEGATAFSTLSLFQC